MDIPNGELTDDARIGHGLAGAGMGLVERFDRRREVIGHTPYLES